jgi:RNA polymerase sigma-70 factor (ECF subfamily)
VGAHQLALTRQMHGTTQYASEDELLAACRRQEIAAFEVLYLQHGARLKSVAYHIVRSRQDAEDAVQETFLKAYRAIAGFRGQASVATWLCRIVVNTSYDIARKRRQETEPSPQLEAPRTFPNLRMALDDALRRINPKLRMVFLLFEVEGFKHSEIASILDIPEGTSKAWLFEARNELRQLLSPVLDRRQG